MPAYYAARALTLAVLAALAGGLLMGKQQDLVVSHRNPSPPPLYFSSVEEPPVSFNEA